MLGGRHFALRGDGLGCCLPGAKLAGVSGLSKSGGVRPPAALPEGLLWSAQVGEDVAGARAVPVAGRGTEGLRCVLGAG